MSPNYITFVVGELDYVEEFFGMDRKKRLRIFAPKIHIHKAQFKYVAELSSNLLKFYEEYFNCTANLAKMDLVFAPTYDLLESW